MSEVPVAEIPHEIMQRAMEIEIETLNKDCFSVTKIIARAILAEREKAASIVQQLGDNYLRALGVEDSRQTQGQDWGFLEALYVAHLSIMQGKAHD